MEGESGETNRMRQWLGVTVAVMVVQLIYWLVISPLFFQAVEPEHLIDTNQGYYATIANPDPAALVAAPFRAVPFATMKKPIEDCCKPGYRAARFVFQQPDVPSGSLGIMPIVAADNYRMYINGSLIFGEGRMVLPDITYLGNSRSLHRIPQGALRPGANTVDFIMVRDTGSPFFQISPPGIGEYEVLRHNYSQRLFSQNDYALFSLGFGFILSVLIIVAWARSDRPALLFWIGLLTMAWTMRLSYHYMTDPPIHGAWRIAYLYVSVCLVPYAWANLANHWCGMPRRWLAVGSTILLALVLSYDFAALGLGSLGTINTIDIISQLFVLLTTIAAFITFLVDLPRQRAPRRLETAIFSLCMSLLAWDAVTTLLHLHGDGHTKRAMPFLLLAIVTVFVARNVRLFRSMEQFNALLSGQLIQRTAELEHAHAREKALVRVQAHQQERQRIMRDMHDGLGSQLMSMLLAARRGMAQPAVVAEGLQTVIDEMRLLIDSMDSVGESLGAAFAVFRERVRPRVEGAGMKFAWRDETDCQLPNYGPRDVLQVFRIMQEAVINALKHSNGSNLTVSLLPSSDPAFALRLEIADDGNGMGKANPRGKGLESMAARAASIGGRFEVLSLGKGVSVLLDLPAPNTSQGMP